MTNPFHKAVTELKVIATTAATAAVGVVVGVLNAVVANPGMLGPYVPGWAQFVVLALVPPVATYIVGYLTPHTERPDLAPRPERHPL